jgi:hypothetical protein
MTSICCVRAPIFSSGRNLTLRSYLWQWKFPFKYSGSDKSNVIVKEKGQGDWMKADTFSA